MKQWSPACSRGGGMPVTEAARAPRSAGGGREAREAGEAQVGGAPSAHRSPHFCGPRQRDLAKGFRFTHCDSRGKLRESFLVGHFGGRRDKRSQACPPRGRRSRSRA